MSENIPIPGMPEKDSAMAELEAHELLDEFDKRAFIQAAMRKTAFAVFSYVNDLRNSTALQYTRENMATWLGEKVTDKRNIRVTLAVGGAALALITARKLLGPDWDKKISSSIQNIAESIKRQETTFSIECELGTLGQTDTAKEIFDELGNEIPIAGEQPCQGALPTGVAFIRNAFVKTVFPHKDPLKQPPQE